MLVKLLAFIASSYIACLLVPKRMRWVVLLVASFVFYALAGIKALLTMFLFSGISFAFGIAIEDSAVGSKRRRTLLVAVVLLVVAWILAIKLCVASGYRNLIIAIPLGASYVSFSIISYLADIYWERDKADRNFLKHLLYILFFPKITEGPINKHKTLAQSLYEGQDLTYRNFCFGSQRMLYGIFKKLVIAERLSMITDGILSDLAGYSGCMIAAATVFAAIELYCDFSGYMDIVLGFTETLGIKMDENFRRPFFSRSTSEFWRRWHITLGTWFKDYVYTPLVMSGIVKKMGKWCRKKIGKEFGNGLMKAVALSAVWLLTGMWHGTGASYIAWGCWCGTIIILSTFLEGFYKKALAFLHINTKAPSWKLFQMFRTSAVFCFGIMLTRLPDLHHVGIAIRKFVREPGLSQLFSKDLFRFGVSVKDFILMLLFLLGVLCVSIMQERRSVREFIASMNAPVRWVIYAAGISIVVFFGIYGPGHTMKDFVYAQF